jgi:hypothetical protein
MVRLHMPASTSKTASWVDMARCKLPFAQHIERLLDLRNKFTSARCDTCDYWEHLRYVIIFTHVNGSDDCHAWNETSPDGFTQRINLSRPAIVDPNVNTEQLLTQGNDGQVVGNRIGCLRWCVKIT